MNGIRTAWRAATDGELAGAAGAAWDGTNWLSRAPEMVYELVSVLSVVLRFLSTVLRSEEVRSVILDPRDR